MNVYEWNGRNSSRAERSIRGLFSSEEWALNLQKVGVNEIMTPLFRQKFYDPHHRYTLPPKQAKTVLKSVFEQNKHTICGHLVTPYILVVKNFMTPLFFFPKIYDPPSIFGIPSSEENDSPPMFYSRGVAELDRTLDLSPNDKHSLFVLYNSYKDSNIMKQNLQIVMK